MEQQIGSGYNEILRTGETRHMSLPLNVSIHLNLSLCFYCDRPFDTFLWWASCPDTLNPPSVSGVWLDPHKAVCQPLSRLCVYVCVSKACVWQATQARFQLAQHDHTSTLFKTLNDEIVTSGSCSSFYRWNEHPLTLKKTFTIYNIYSTFRKIFYTKNHCSNILHL